MEINIDPTDIQSWQNWNESLALLRKLEKSHGDLVDELRNFVNTRKTLKANDELSTDTARDLKTKIAELYSSARQSAMAVKQQHHKHQRLCEQIGKAKVHAWRRACKKHAGSFPVRALPPNNLPAVPSTGC